MNESAPLVSIVIPLYNAENYIEETLLSIVNQTYSNYEVIVIDNASTDSSLSIIKNFSENRLKLKVIECDKNSGGPACPRNIGIEHANGQYIAFLDSDDLWSERKLETQISLMIRNDYNFTCTSKSFIDRNGLHFTRRIDELLREKSGHYGVKELIIRNSITTSSVIVCRKFLASDRFSELDFINCVEDYLLWLMLMSKKECKFYHIKDKLVDYRLSTQSLSNTDGNKLILVKSMLASCIYMVKCKSLNYFLYSLISHVIRFFSLSFRR
ncbi:glycosyltransferase family 2 protein [Vibrio cholerae]|uniref:glycosyltransferase family 2 protein n=2 Tax=Vibrio cholerae TaxID=666 RepID=UPI000E0BD5CB|nr:glycosyltransferase family 2 protein [Vibrio cholerae]EGR3962701.1 glycosyltransferase family 2 protein [Vibrio cholerae]